MGLAVMSPYAAPREIFYAPSTPGAALPLISSPVAAPMQQPVSIVSTTSVPQVTAPVPQMLSIPQPSALAYQGQAVAPASGTSAGIQDNSTTSVLPAPTSGQDTYQGIDLTAPVDTYESQAVLAAAAPVAVVAPAFNPLWLLAGGLALLALL